MSDVSCPVSCHLFLYNFKSVLGYCSMCTKVRIFIHQKATLVRSVLKSYDFHQIFFNPQKGNNRNWTTSTSSLTDGYYPVSIRAGNLHSDPFFGVNKADENVTLGLFIQFPVINWVLNAKPYWIMTNGCKHYISHFLLLC